jgi:lipopolysaccharide transport system permease protein
VAGGLWALLNPAATILVCLFVFSVVIRVPVRAEEVGTDRFSLFFLSGFFPWLLFSESVGRTIGVAVQNANLITKVAFPVELLPLGTVLSAFFLNGVGLGVYLLILTAFGYAHASWLFLLLLVPMLSLFAYGISAGFCAANVFFRDLQEAVGILLMIWFYATPVIYPISLIPERYRCIIDWNPMAVFISAFRDVLLIHQPSAGLMLKVLVISFFTFAAGSWFFDRCKTAFGDVL